MADSSPAPAIRTLKIWDPSKEPAAQCVATLQGHTSWIRWVTLLSDGDSSPAPDKTLKIWDPSIGTGSTMCRYPAGAHSLDPRCVTQLPDGRFVSGSNDGP